MSLCQRAIGGLLLLWCLQPATFAARDQPPVDLQALARSIREAIRIDYASRSHFTYIERQRDVDISRLGKVSVGPLRTFEVYPSSKPGDTWKRLIAVDGKPLDPDELARRDREHERDLLKKAEREKTESPRQRAARLLEEAEEIRERDAILDDAYAVFELGFICRETFDDQPVIVLSLKPRAQARVTTREGEWMKQFSGKIWVSDPGHHIARLELRAMDDVSIGWGVVARIHSGSGFTFVRKKIQDAWLPSELTLEGSGRTLLFRKFQVKTVTTYSDHKRAGP
jgi:hypothetical protein